MPNTLDSTTHACTHNVHHPLLSSSHKRKKLAQCSVVQPAACCCCSSTAGRWCTRLQQEDTASQCLPNLFMRTAGSRHMPHCSCCTSPSSCRALPANSHRQLLLRSYSMHICHAVSTQNATGSCMLLAIQGEHLLTARLPCRLTAAGSALSLDMHGQLAINAWSNMTTLQLVKRLVKHGQTWMHSQLDYHLARAVTTS
jgi:hypothetical protein